MKKIVTISIVLVILVIVVVGVALFASWSSRETKTSDNQTETSVTKKEPLKETTYSVAKTFDAPYKCEYETELSVEGTLQAVAYVQGEDYKAEQTIMDGGFTEKPLFIQKHTKKNNFIYAWTENVEEPGVIRNHIAAGDKGGYKYDVTKLQNEIDNFWIEFEGFRDHEFFFSLPPEDAKCVLVDSVDISYPTNPADGEFVDRTETLIKRINSIWKDFKETVDPIPVDVYLPQWFPADVSGPEISLPYIKLPGAVGEEMPDDKKTIELEYSNDFNEEERFVIGLEFSRVSPEYYNPPLDCRTVGSSVGEVLTEKLKDIEPEFKKLYENLKKPKPCEEIVTTSKGYKVYHNRLGQEYVYYKNSYFIKIEDTLIKILYTHEMSDEDLIKFINSWKKLENKEDVIKRINRKD